MAKSTAPPPQDKTSPASRSPRRSAAPAKTAATSRADQASRRLGSNSIGDFYRESISELRKVTWPNWQDASNLTVAVIGMTVAIAAFLGLADEILNLAIKPILGQ